MHFIRFSHMPQNSLCLQDITIHHIHIPRIVLPKLLKHKNPQIVKKFYYTVPGFTQMNRFTRQFSIYFGVKSNFTVSPV